MNHIHVQCYEASSLLPPYPYTQWSKRRPGADKVPQILKEHFPSALYTQDAFLDAVLSTLSSAPSDPYDASRVLSTLDTPQQGKVLFVKFQLTATDEASMYIKVTPYIHIHNKGRRKWGLSTSTERVFSANAAPLIFPPVIYPHLCAGAPRSPRAPAAVLH